ncbi:MAG: peroxiredoxin [Bacteriovoracaceae bacterium]|nr:peroxiredoxin [Bacteroidota bacterium]
MAITVGQKAPNFTLADAYRKPVSLTDFIGKKVVVFFYPGAFTAVCEKEMCSIRDTMADFNSGGAQVLGISVDAPASNKAFADKNGLKFPLLSDYTRYVSAQYCGLINNFVGLVGLTAANRSAFIIDENGIVTYAWISENPGVEPPYDEVKKALA